MQYVSVNLEKTRWNEICPYVELIAFDYNQHVILIRTQMLDSSQLGQHQILGPNLPKII